MVYKHPKLKLGVYLNFFNCMRVTHYCL